MNQIQTCTLSPPPVQHTHLTVAIMKALKALPLNIKLRRNKIIKKKMLIAFSKLWIMYDPVNHPTPSSEQASMITINTDEMHTLHSSSLLDSLKAIVPFYLLQRIALLNKSKRKQPEDSVMDLTEVHDTKR